MSWKTSEPTRSFSAAQSWVGRRRSSGRAPRRARRRGREIASRSGRGPTKRSFSIRRAASGWNSDAPGRWSAQSGRAVPRGDPGAACSAPAAARSQARLRRGHQGDERAAALGLAAGPERAVAASKTFLNTVAALVWVAGGAAGRGDEIAEGLRRVSNQLSETLESLEQAVSNVAMAFAYVGRMYVIGRGIEFGTAREVALKLTETCRVAAEPLTATDLAHGPIAALD